MVARGCGEGKTPRVQAGINLKFQSINTRSQSIALHGDRITSAVPLSTVVLVIKLPACVTALCACSPKDDIAEYIKQHAELP